MCKPSFGFLIFLICLVATMNISCNENDRKTTNENKIEEAPRNTEKKNVVELIREKPDSIQTPSDMVWVSGIEFTMGARDSDPYALPREKPQHPVAVDGFFIDKTEVTNAQFSDFVEATSYITVAERPIDWELMKTQLPEGTPKPHDSLLQPGSLIFRKDLKSVRNLADHSQWWEWKKGANWRHPEGPQSTITDKENYPVVHIAYEDAQAYAKWANKSLPTEAEWEAAAHGKMHGGIYPWGDDEEGLNEQANTWEGQFPLKNTGNDRFLYYAPVKSFPPNSLGIYDMAGNVWELTSDNYNVQYYTQIVNKGLQINPKGASTHYNPDNPYQKEKVIKGGSFLCNKSYCASYRISARMGLTLDSGSDHVGFRTVKRVKTH